ncbi:hypothetical protein F4779DRAFT_170454 [Xylariaceae sp. FL0662B]|nr:hypothetical protein F4779DRAFT_170454 [Xylariaceae sp. FL0662B]
MEIVRKILLLFRINYCGVYPTRFFFFFSVPVFREPVLHVSSRDPASSVVRVSQQNYGPVVYSIDGHFIETNLAPASPRGSRISPFHGESSLGVIWYRWCMQRVFTLIVHSIPIRFRNSSWNQQNFLFICFVFFFSDIVNFLVSQRLAMIWRGG